MSASPPGAVFIGSKLVLLKQACFTQVISEPCHTGQSSGSGSRNILVKAMFWPQNSSDMNPIEHLWFHLENRVRAVKLPPRNCRTSS